MEQVTALRRFNRYFTRRIGVLDDHYLGQDRPLGEARLLFEIHESASEASGSRRVPAGAQDAARPRRRIPEPDGEGPGGSGPGPHERAPR